MSEEADQVVEEAYVRGLCFDDPSGEAADRTVLKMRYRRELRALKEKHRSVKTKVTNNGDTKSKRNH